MSAAESVIEVDQLQKTFRSGWLRRREIRALQGVSLTVPRGRIFGLLGPNGAGKTTLIKILLGIVRKSGGDARVLGHRAGDIAARRRIGYLPENHRIPQHLTGQTALEYYGCLSGLSVGEVRRRSPELLKTVGLSGREKDRVAGYSKGMLQRLGLAQAMLHRPELIILDEPTDGVDPVGRTEIRGVLRALSGDGATVFLNSHLLQEIELVCDSVAILAHGQLRKSGRVRDLTQAVEGSAVEFRLRGEWSVIEAALAEVGGEGSEALEAHGEDVFQVQLKLAGQPEVDRTIDTLRAAAVSIVSMRRREPTLEEAFLRILREDTA